MQNDWLEATDLQRYYIRGPQEVRALDGVSLTVAAGEFLAIVGSSGSGKSTLLNLLAGLDTATGGEITVDGSAFSTLTRRELARYRASQVGMVFQSFNLLPYKSALENVELALYFNHSPRPERRTRSVELLTRLGLGERLDHKPSDLSGGEQQRVAIARALVKAPRALFADEPTGNLDHDNAQQIAELLQKLNGEGLTVIMVTHNLELAQRYARRIVRMNYGKIVTDSAAAPGAER
ncbi:MAG TPA: ABC transporter ATP-binding protein [candidate division Zixibacteria bacterium]|nr:ABC transporter ATP-binding protein [candidate division Zixibacteria bacterium]